LIAIAGGSGAGKTWLASELQKLFGDRVERLSLDDFYRDRSHLSEKQRERLNFDHPKAIDWQCVEEVLRVCLSGRAARLPQYDFKTHTRTLVPRIMEPRPLVIMDGLWLLRRPAVRRLFAFRIFIDCPAKLRLSRRLERDLSERGRSAASIRRQFHQTVGPMHDRFVAAQSRWADLVISKPPTRADVCAIAQRLESFLAPRKL
jgi:uridine kinase